MERLSLGGLAGSRNGNTRIFFFGAEEIVYRYAAANRDWEFRVGKVPDTAPDVAKAHD